MSGPGQDAEPEELDEARLLALAVGFVRLFLEVESGRRTRHELEQLMAPRLAVKLAEHWVRGGPPRTISAARGLSIAPGIFEAVIVARGRTRAGAIALRMERRVRRWRVRELVRPEDGALPEPVTYLPLIEPCAFTVVCPVLELRPRPENLPPPAALPAAVGPPAALPAAVGL